MPHFALLCPAAAGHVLPIGSLGIELNRRGHEVTLLGPRAASELTRKLGIRHHELDTDSVRYPFNWPMWTVFSLFGAGWKIALRDAFRWRAEFIMRLVPEALRDLKCDGLIVDQTLTAGGTVAELLALPFVTVCTGMPWNEDLSLPPPFTRWNFTRGRLARLRNRLGYASWRWYTAPFLRTVNRYRQQWQLPRLPNVDASYSPFAQLSQLCAELDYPHEVLPEVFHYVGPLASVRQEDRDQFDWSLLDDRPLIFASLGTEPYRSNLAVYQRILRACEGLDAQLVLALGKWREKPEVLSEALGDVPENAVVVDYAPQLAMLDKAAMMITHAGSNSAMEALARGVPLIALPRAEDQPGMATRIQFSGAGLQASFHHCSIEQLRSMVTRVLTQEGFKACAKDLKKAILRAGGVKRAADITEYVISTGTPALRSKFEHPCRNQV